MNKLSDFQMEQHNSLKIYSRTLKIAKYFNSRLTTYLKILTKLIASKYEIKNVDSVNMYFYYFIILMNGIVVITYKCLIYLSVLKISHVTWTYPFQE